MRHALPIIAVVFALADIACSATLPKCFEAAHVAPQDVTLYLHVEDAAALRKQLAGRPILTWLESIAQKGDSSKAWTKLAQATQSESGDLFDSCFGKRATLLQRGPGQWALISEVDDSRIAKLLQQLKPRVREPRHGMAVSELPEQELLMARGERLIVLGPSRQPDLVLDLLKRINQNNESSLATDDAMLKASELGEGQIGLFIRHDRPMGGYSVVSAQLNGDRLALSHAANFENAPFARGVTRLTCDFTPVLRFEGNALAAMMQPTDIGDGPVEAFLQANLKEPLVSQEMRRNMGERRMVVIGEVDGRELQRPVDLLCTTFATCVEVKDSEIAVQHLDRQMVKITQRLNAMGQGAFLIQTPQVAALRSGEPREIDLAQASEWFTGGFPVMKNVSLNWNVVEGPQSAWFVVASHRKSLEEVSLALKTEAVTNPRYLGKFDSCGSGNGLRISRHVRTWIEQAEELAAPGHAEELRSTLTLMADLAGGIQNCSWQLQRPTPNQMRLNVQIKLAPAESSRESD